MEPNFDLHFGREKKSKRSGKAGKGAAKRWMAILLTVILVAGNCVPVTAAEVSDATGADSAGITEEYEQEPETVSEEQNAGEEGTQAFSDEESEEDGKSEASEESDTSEETGADEEEADGAPAEESETETAATEISGSDEGDEQTNAADPSEENAETGLTEDDAVLEEPLEAEEVSKEALAQADGWLADYDYNIISLDEIDEVVYLFGYNGSETDITVPGTVTIDGVEYPVTASPDTWGSIYPRSIVFGDGFIFTNDLVCFFRYYSRELESVDMSRADTSRLTSMNRMFYRCSSLKYVNLGDIDTSNVSDVSYMFRGCSAIEEIDLHCLSNAQITYAKAMFRACSSLQTLDLGGVNLVMAMEGQRAELFFDGCTSLQEIVAPVIDDVADRYRIDLPGYYQDEAGNIYNTLKSSSVSGRILHVVEIPSWLQDYKFDYDSDNRTITLRKYQGDDSELTVPGSVTIGTAEYQIRLTEKEYIWGSGVTKLTFGNVKFSGYLKRLFYKATRLKYLDLSEADFSEAEYADSMLTRCEKLKTILAPAGLSVFVKLPSTFFDENDNQYTQLPKKLTGSIELHALPISEWLEDYTYQISGDTIILKYYNGEDVDLTVPTSAAIGSTTYDKIRILRGVWPRSIVSLSFEGPVDLSHYTYTMFKNMNQLEQLDLSNQSEVLYNANEMFYNCSKLQEIDLSGFDFSQCSKTNNMFYGCKALQTIKTPVNVSVEVELPGVYSDSEGNLYSSIPANQENSITLTKVTDVSEWLNDYEFGVEGDRIVLKKHNRGYYQTLTVPGNAVVGNKEFHKVELSRNMWGNAQAVHLSFEEGVILPQDSSGLFRNLRATSIDLSNVNTGEATDMSDMFTGCSNLNTIITPKNVKCDANLPRAFTDDSGNLYSYLPKNLNASVTLTRVDQSSWLNKFNYVISGDKIILTNYTAGYTSNLTVPGSAEVNGTSFGKIEIAKTINWSKYYIRNLSFSEGVVFPEDSSGMFENCTYLRSIDISNVDTSNVVNMSRMFYRCKACTALDVSHFNTSKVTDMSYMFSDCSKLTTLDVSGFDTSNVTNMSQMFSSCGKLSSLDLSGFNTPNVTDMSRMFYDCVKLTSLDVSGLNTSCVTDMSQMFYNCGMLTSLNVSGLDTSGVTDMSQMFYNCEMLTSLDTSGFDTSNVRNMHAMFQGCSNLKTLNVSGFYTPNATDLSNMFYHCDNVKTLDVSGFDTSNVTNMYAMFGHCRSVKNLNVSGFDTSNAQNISYMFYRCTSLLKLDISNWDLSSVVDGYRFFGNGDTLGMINSPAGLSVQIDLPAIYTGSDGRIYKELPRKKDNSIVLTWTSYYDDSAYSESGNPWYSESGNPWYSESGNPWSSESGNPWSSESGNPWSSESGNPWSSESGNPTQGPIWIVEQPKDVRALSGKTATFKVTAAGTGLGYQWQWSTDGMTWKNCSSGTYNTDTFSFKMRDNLDGRMYRCVITKGTRKAYTRFALLSLAQVEITEQPADVEAASGESVTFHVGADGIDPVFQWQWSTDGGATWRNCATGAYNTDTFGFTMKTTLSGRQYRCIVSAGGEEVVSDPANLTLWTEPEFIVQPEDAEVAAGGEVTFHVEVDGKNPVYQWQWSTDGAIWKNCTSGGYNTDTFSFVMKATLSGRQYRCIVTCGRSTLTSEAGTITLAVTPEIISQPSDIEAAAGETVTFTVGVQGKDPAYQWQWSTDGATWKNCTSGGYNTDTFSFTMKSTLSGRQYRCKVTCGGQILISEPGTITFVVRPEIISQPSDIEAAVGETVTFTVGVQGDDPAYQWQWSADGTSWKNCTSGGYNTDTFSFTMKSTLSGRQYRCKVTCGGQLLVSEAGTITLVVRPEIISQPADAQAAVGETVTLNVGVQGDDPAYQWQWSADGATWKNCTSGGCNTDTFSFTMKATVSGRQYRCKVTCGGQTLISNAATITLFIPLEIISQPSDVQAAAGETVAFTVEARSNVEGEVPSYQWQWSSNGTTWKNCTSGTYNTDTFSFVMKSTLSGRQYRCKVTCGEETLISEAGTVTLRENAVMH